MRMRSCFAISLALVVACGKGGDGSGSGGGTGGGKTVASGSAQAPKADGGVELFVNDKSVAKVAPADLAARPRLDTLVPIDARRIGSWSTVIVTLADGKTTEFKKPGDRYRDSVIALYDEAGKPMLGIFDPVALAKKDAPAEKAGPITAIKIVADTSGGRGQNESGAGGGTDPTKLEIAVHTPKGDSVFTGEQLLELDRVVDPTKDDTKGWTLGAILKAAGVTAYQTVTLADAKGTPLPIDKATIDDPNSVVFLKLNKSGELRVRIFKKQGTGYQTAGDLRGLAKIDVK